MDEPSLLSLPARFQMLGELGRGGMAVVYHAYDTASQRHVAIKLLPKNDDEQHKRRFRREAADLAAVFHPNVVDFYAVGESDGREFIEMEYVDGGNLAQFIRSKPGLPAVLQTFAAVCDGLDHIHNRGIVHRDLKPANVLMTKAGVPKITDLGLARRIEGRSQLTMDGALVGTCSYMSPEQLLSSNVGPPTDLYAIGIALFEAVTGRHPFVADSQPAMLRAHLHETPVAPSSVVPGLPGRLDSIILSLLEKEPGKRTASAARVRSALLACLEELSVKGDGPLSLLQGRAEALGALTRMALGGLGESGLSLLVVAPAESGRSALLDELSGHLRSRGVEVVFVGPGQPPAALLTCLGAPAEELHRLIRCGGHELVAGEVRRRLSLRERPTLLLADDVERLPAITQGVLEALAQLTPPPRAGWLLSVTPARAFALPEDAHRFDLAPLTEDDLRALAERELQSRLSPELAEWLLPRAGGSPRQLKLWMLALRGEGCLRVQGEVMEIADPKRLPSSPTEAIVAGIERLEEEPRMLARTLALMPEPATFDLAGPAAGLSEERADRSADLLLRLGIVEETPKERFRLASAQVRQKVASSLPDRLRRRIHARLAEVLTDTLERGRHLGLSGETTQAADLLLAEARQAFEQERYEDSAPLFEAAAAFHEGSRALLGRSRSLAALGRLREAETCAATIGVGKESLLLLAELKYHRGAWEDAFSLCKSVDKPTPEQAPRREALLASIYEKEGNLPEAAAAYRRALELEPGRPDKLLRGLARVQNRLGQAQEARDSLKRAMELARQRSDRESVLDSLLHLAELEGEGPLLEGVTVATEAGWPDQEARMQMALAQRREAGGDRAGACQAWKRAVKLLRPFGESPRLAESLSGLGRTQTDPGPAETALREGVRAADATRDPVARADTRRELGAFLLAAERAEAGRQTLQEAVEHAEASGQHAPLAAALSELTRALLLTQDSERALMAGERAVEAARKVGEPLVLGEALLALGAVAKTLHAMPELGHLFPGWRIEGVSVEKVLVRERRPFDAQVWIMLSRERA